jgi:hypothetical protein
MNAGTFLFRFRMLIMACILFIGFWAPWIQLFGVGSRISLLEWIALEVSRAGLFSFTIATPVVIVCGSLIAALGAVLRIWGSAWLGHGIVINSNMQAVTVMADGPYRYVRNPLYLGLLCMMAAMSLIMPASGRSVRNHRCSARSSPSSVGKKHFSPAGSASPTAPISRSAASVSAPAHAACALRQQAALGAGTPLRDQPDRRLHHHCVSVMDLRQPAHDSRRHRHLRTLACRPRADAGPAQGCWRVRFAGLILYLVIEPNGYITTWFFIFFGCLPPSLPRCVH